MARVFHCKVIQEYGRTSNQRLLTASVQATVSKYKLNGKLIGDVALGSILTFPSKLEIFRAKWFLYRRSTNAGQHVQRCVWPPASKQPTSFALKIAAGQIESGIAGGSDTNSDLIFQSLASGSLGWKRDRHTECKNLWKATGCVFLKIRPDT